LHHHLHHVHAHFHHFHAFGHHVIGARHALAAAHHAAFAHHAALHHRAVHHHSGLHAARHVDVFLHGLHVFGHGLVPRLVRLRLGDAVELRLQLFHVVLHRFDLRRYLGGCAFRFRHFFRVMCVIGENRC
jgi:hypothetical protein